MSNVTTKQQAAIEAATKLHAAVIAAFFAKSKAADVAHENMSQATVAADSAKRAAILALSKAMVSAGFANGFPSAEAKAAFKDAFMAAAGASQYRQGYADNLWSQLMTSTTAENGQTFKVVSADAVTKAKQREKSDRETKALLKKLGVGNATPEAIKAQAAKVVTSDTKLAKTLLDEAERRERQAAKDEAATAKASEAKQRTHAIALVKGATAPQLAALIQAAVKLGIKPAATEKAKTKAKLEKLPEAEV
jgi:colicin import membrane protein